MVTGDSKEEVMIFRDKQTLHHNIYIIVIIFITTTIVISKIRSKDQKRTKCDDMKTLQHAALAFNIQQSGKFMILNKKIART